MSPTPWQFPPHNQAVYSVLARRGAEGRPIRVALVGAGATGRAIALQLGTPVAGIRLAGISNRTPAHAERAFREAGISGWRSAATPAQAASIISSGAPVITDDPDALIRCPAIDLV